MPVLRTVTRTSSVPPSASAIGLNLTSVTSSRVVPPSRIVTGAVALAVLPAASRASTWMV